MNDAFHASARLPPDALRGLLVRRDGPGMARFGLQYGAWLAAGAATVALADGPWPGFLAAFLAFSALLASLFAPMHEALHRTVFRARWANDLLAWLTGAPLLSSPPSYRRFHFAHHRHTQDPKLDPEISLAPGRLSPWPATLPEYAGAMSGLPLLGIKAVALLAMSVPHGEAWWARWLPFVPPAQRPRAAWGARAVLALHAALLVAAIRWPALLWLEAAQIPANALLALYLSAEHSGLPASGSILERTRTIRAAAPVRWLMWNMPYHAEHHAYPAVPFHALPALHALLAPELPHLAPGYGPLHAEVVRACVGRRPPAC